jgi:hypothetical protein
MPLNKDFPDTGLCIVAMSTPLGLWLDIVMTRLTYDAQKWAFDEMGWTLRHVTSVSITKV